MKVDFFFFLTENKTTDFYTIHCRLLLAVVRPRQLDLAVGIGTAEHSGRARDVFYLWEMPLRAAESLLGHIALHCWLCGNRGIYVFQYSIIVFCIHK